MRSFPCWVLELSPRWSARLGQAGWLWHQDKFKHYECRADLDWASKAQLKRSQSNETIWSLSSWDSQWQRVRSRVSLKSEGCCQYETKLYDQHIWRGEQYSADQHWRHALHHSIWRAWEIKLHYSVQLRSCKSVWLSVVWTQKSESGKADARYIQ